MSHYETLGISRGATQSEIRAAYKTLMKRHHPDISGSDQVAISLGEAFSVLSNNTARSKYDLRLPGPSLAQPNRDGSVIRDRQEYGSPNVQPEETVGLPSRKRANPPDRKKALLLLNLMSVLTWGVALATAWNHPVAAAYVALAGVLCFVAALVGLAQKSTYGAIVILVTGVIPATVAFGLQERIPNFFSLPVVTAYALLGLLLFSLIADFKRK